MKVLMLGWEYPPHISGGLGTACEGLTKGLARQGVDIDFVVPHLYGGEDAPHMHLMDPVSVAGPTAGLGQRHHVVTEVIQEEGAPVAAVETGVVGGKRLVGSGTTEGSVNFIRVPSFLTPYLSAATAKKRLTELASKENLTEEEYIRLQMERIEEMLPPMIRSMLPSSLQESGNADHYNSDLFSEVGRFTARVLGLVKGVPHWDMIHAHDWMTFPAGIALKAVTGLPLVLHVHSLEYDRCGGNGNWQIEQIERAALDAADTVIAVSYYTRNLIHQRHGTPLEKIHVVHNGVYTSGAVQSYRAERPWPSKIVLFLGRVTFQKGPDYFVESAARVIPHVPDVLFVMAGSGDMLPRMMDRVAELGITNNFLFTGFLKGQEVEKMFSMADLYVMPSVSEPFGISALEAIAYNTPVIISRQSGVSEVLSHALKVNFWDVEQMANLIISGLTYPELAQDMNAMASEEVRRLRWDASATTAVEIYHKTLGHG